MAQSNGMLRRGRRLFAYRVGKGLCRVDVVGGCLSGRELGFSGLDPHDVECDLRPRGSLAGPVEDRIELRRNVEPGADHRSEAYSVVLFEVDRLTEHLVGR